MSAAGDKLLGAAREAQLLGRITKLTAERDKWRRMETEAAQYVETVICLRTGFTGEPPHVGWKGLGLALTEALDERDALRADVTRLTASLAAAEAEFAAFIESMDYPRMSPDAEEARCYDEMLEYMGRCWEARAALSDPAS